jgi:hypothetical protein
MEPDDDDGELRTLDIIQTVRHVVDQHLDAPVRPVLA